MLYRIVTLLFRFVVRRGWMRLAAHLLVQLTRSRVAGRPYRVLCLAKPVFGLDMEAIIRRSRQVSYLLFPRLLLSEIVRRHVPQFNALNDATYHPLLDGTEAQKLIQADMRIVVDVLRRRLSIDAIIAGNFVYVSQQELFAVAAEAGIPTIVLYKEGMIPVGKYEYAGSVLYTTKRFLASRILFYNEHIRSAMLASGLKGLSAEQTSVVGVPRFDEYVDVARAPIASTGDTFRL